MSSDAEIEAKFWKELKASPFVMLGLSGSNEAHGQPMTAFFDEGSGPIWFFCNNDNTLVEALGESHDAICNYAGKGHDLFAAVHGRLSVDNDPATIDRFWNPRVEAWFEGGRNDPKLTLLRLDTSRAQLWITGSSVGAFIEKIRGVDPKESYKDKMADVAL